MQSKLTMLLTTTADRIRDTHKHPEIQEADEAFTKKLGEQIADVFKLRRDPEHRDRWQTTEGSKSAMGLARTIIRILEEASQ